MFPFVLVVMLEGSFSKFSGNFRKIEMENFLYEIGEISFLTMLTIN